MRLDHQKSIAMAGDVMASAGALVMAASHWAEVLTPIVTLLVGLATLAWWGLRFVDRWRGRSVGE